MKFKVHRFDSVESTNSVVFDLANKGEPEGYVCLAGHQTHGRGRFTRKWSSPKGKNLLVSILLRPPVAPNKAPMLTQITCRSVQRVLKDSYDIASTLKAPNDVMIKKKKICGILVQTRSNSKERLDCAVVGIGLNINNAPLPTATCIKDVKGREYSIERFLEIFLKQFKKDLQPFYDSSR